MKRREFLIKSSLLAALFNASSSTYANQAAPLRESTLYFDYKRSMIGVELGNGFIEALNRIDSHSHHFNFIDKLDSQVLSMSELVVTSNPDDQNLLQMTSAEMTIDPLLYSNLPYNPVTSFKPLCTYGYSTFILVVGAAIDPGIKTLNEYISWVKDNPEFREIGIAHYGSESHLASLILARNKRIALRPIYYGATPLIIEDLKAKELAACIIRSGYAVNEMETGEFRALAVCSKERHIGMPDVPTMLELGVPDMNMKGWYGLMAPSQMSSGLYNEYFNLCSKALYDPLFIELRQTFLLENGIADPELIHRTIQEEIAINKLLFNKYNVSRI